MRKTTIAFLISLSVVISAAAPAVAGSIDTESEITSSENTEITINPDQSQEESVFDSESDELSEMAVSTSAYVTYPDAVSSNHTFVTKTGKYKSCTWMYLVPGKSVKFNIGDENGTKIKGAGKEAVWSISGNSYFTVKKGKVKLNKNAAAVGPGVSKNDVASAILSAEYGGETIYLGLVAIKKTKYVGYLKDAKLEKTGKIYGKVGVEFDLRNLNSMLKEEVIASYKAEKSGSSRTYLYFADLEELAPRISCSKKLLEKAEVTYDETGSLTKFRPLSKGNYKITYKLRDGSGCSFSLTLVAEN